MSEVTRVSIEINVDKNRKTFILMKIGSENVWKSEEYELGPSGGSIKFENVAIPTKNLVEYLVANCRFK